MGRPSLPSMARNRYRDIDDLIAQLESFEDEDDKRARPMSSDYDTLQPSWSKPNVLYWSIIIAEEVRRESLWPDQKEIDVYGVERVDEGVSGPRFRIPLALRGLDTTSVTSIADRLARHAIYQDYPNNSSKEIMARSSLAPQRSPVASPDTTTDQPTTRTDQLIDDTTSVPDARHSNHLAVKAASASRPSYDGLDDTDLRAPMSIETAPNHATSMNTTPAIPAQRLNTNHAVDEDATSQDETNVEVARRSGYIPRSSLEAPHYPMPAPLKSKDPVTTSTQTEATPSSVVITGSVLSGVAQDEVNHIDLDPVDPAYEDDIDMNESIVSPTRHTDAPPAMDDEVVMEDDTHDSRLDDQTITGTGVEADAGMDVEVDDSVDDQDENELDNRAGNISHITAYPSVPNERGRRNGSQDAGPSNATPTPAMTHRTGNDRCVFCTGRDITVCITSRPIVASKPLACDSCHKRRTRCSLAVDSTRLKVGRGMASEVQAKLIDANALYTKKGDDAGADRVKKLVDKLQTLIDLNPGM